MKSLAGNRFSPLMCSCSDRSQIGFFLVFSLFGEKPPHWFSDAQQGTNGNLMSLSMLTDNALLHREGMGCTSQSVNPKVAAGQLKQQQDRSRTVPSSAPSYSPPKPEPGAVFTLLITGEGPADRRAITDSPQAPGLGTLQTPAVVSQM